MTHRVSHSWDYEKRCARLSYHAVDAEEWVLHELRCRPFARLDTVVGLDVAID